MRFLIFFLMMVTLAAPGIAGVFNPHTFTLQNGLDVVVIERPGIPIVTQMVWYKTGSKDEVAGKGGLAHFLEHMMFRGTQTTADGDFSKAIAILGGKDNAFTSWEYTAYFQTIPKQHLKAVMSMEADRMANLVLDATLFDVEKNVILEERRMRVGNKPASILNEKSLKKFYRTQPYGQPVIGSAEDIQNLTVEDLRDFYQHHYAPNNATLVVAGDITTEEVRSLAQEVYGPVPTHPVQKNVFPVEPRHLENETLSFHHAHVAQPVITWYYPAPSYLYGATRHALPLQVLEEILGNVETGKLHEYFVVNNNLAVSAGTYYDATRLGMSPFYIQIMPRDGVSHIEKKMAAFLRTVKITKADVTQAIKRLKSEAIFVQDSLKNGPHLLGVAASIDLPFHHIEDWQAHLDQVSLAKVRAALTYLLHQKTLTTYLLPTEAKE